MGPTGYEVGDEIDLFCKKCRLNLHGNVAALHDGQVKTVTCRTCRTTQPFSRERTDSEVRAGVLKRAFAARDRRQKRMTSEVPTTDTMTGSDVTKRWRETTEDVDARYASRYSRFKVYESDEVLIHREHGLGVVTEVLHDNAILVLFRKVETPLEMNAEPEEEEEVE